MRTRVLRVPKVSKMLAGPRIWSVACGKKCERHMGTPEMWRVVLLQGYIKCSEELRRSKRKWVIREGCIEKVTFTSSLKNRYVAGRRM